MVRPAASLPCHRSLDGKTHLRSFTPSSSLPTFGHSVIFEAGLVQPASAQAVWSFTAPETMVKQETSAGYISGLVAALALS